jgi:UDP-2-acetamido-2-deoxy-ribo-hexuluronate aminotransferase
LITPDVLPLTENVISLPMSAWLKDEDMDYIVAAIKELVYKV